MAQSEKDVKNIVLSYLKKKGYSQSEQHFLAESNIQGSDALASSYDLNSETSIANYILFYNSSENIPSRYDECYTQLYEWVHSSLDLFKEELFEILYPIYVHCFLDLLAKGHQDIAHTFLNAHSTEHEDRNFTEVVELKGILSSKQLADSELVRRFRNNKYKVRLCSFSFELLITFLQDKKFMLLLSIVNQYLNIQVYGGQPGETVISTYTGKTDEELERLNKKSVYWGKFDSENDVEELESKKGKKNDLVPDGMKPESNVPLPALDQITKQSMLQDIQQRIPLSSTTLPSICFYSFFHTYQTLNTIEISKDASLVLGGFNDSTVKLWDFQNMEKDDTQKEQDYELLIGHSGPIYGASFSPDNKYLLTSSGDHSTRLWSLETHSNLVCYKGHNYPVWDTDFSPLGFYFATASFDRTARLWSTASIWPLRIFAGHLSDVNCVKFHPNCNYVITGSTDKTARMWEINSGDCVRIFTGHTDSVNTLAVSSDGQTVASAGDDGNVILWDLNTSKIVKKFTGHTKPVYSLDFSAEGNILASGSADQTVRLWDVIGESNSDDITSENKTNLLSTYPTKNTPVTKLKFTGRNVLLAAGPYKM